MDLLIKYNQGSQEESVGARRKASCNARTFLPWVKSRKILEVVGAAAAKEEDLPSSRETAIMLYFVPLLTLKS